MNTDNEWGDRLVKMMLFFDNVRYIAESRQRGISDSYCKFCGDREGGIAIDCTVPSSV